MWIERFVLAHEAIESASFKSKGISIAKPFIFISFIHFTNECLGILKKPNLLQTLDHASADIQIEHMAPIRYLGAALLRFYFPTIHLRVRARLCGCNCRTKENQTPTTAIALPHNE